MHALTHTYEPGKQASTTMFWSWKVCGQVAKNLVKPRKLSLDRKWEKLRDNEVHSRLFQRFGQWHHQILSPEWEGVSWIKEDEIKDIQNTIPVPHFYLKFSQDASQERVKQRVSKVGLPYIFGLGYNQKQREIKWPYVPLPPPSHSFSTWDIRSLPFSQETEILL